MAMEGNGGLGTSKEVQEGQLIGPTLESVAAFPMDDSTQNTCPWLESYIRKLVGEACRHFVMAGPASVAAFPMEDSTHNTFPWLESYIRQLVGEAFGHFVMSRPASVVAFPMNSTQNTSPWLESYIRKLVSEAFEHFVKSFPAMVGGSKRACSSQTDVVTGASQYCPSGIDQTVYPAFLTVPSWAASENSMPDFEDDVLREFPSPSPNPSVKADGNTELSVGRNFNMGVGNRSSLGRNDNMVVRNTSSLGGNVNIPSSHRVNDNMEVRPVMHRSSLQGNVKCEGGGVWNTSSLPGNVKCEGGGAIHTEMASMDIKFEVLSIKEPVD